MLLVDIHILTNNGESFVNVLSSIALYNCTLSLVNSVTDMTVSERIVIMPHTHREALSIHGHRLSICLSAPDPKLRTEGREGSV